MGTMIGIENKERIEAVNDKDGLRNKEGAE
jgi:hypothetical protein